MLKRLLLLLLCLTPALAEVPKFRTIALDISVTDRFDRPYQVQDNTAYVGVRLAQDEKQTNKEVSLYETLSCAGIEYPRLTHDYVKFAVQGGVAHVQFVVFQDNASPVDYELKLIQDNNFYELSPSIWQIGTQSSSDEVKAESLRAPHSSQEIATIVLFGLVGAALGYWLLGRVLFVRMLQRRQMEVSAALLWSNLLVLLSWALVGCGVVTMVFFPLILWKKLWWIYIMVAAGYTLAVGTLYGVGHLFTRS